jgi:hypothetical protein
MRLAIIPVMAACTATLVATASPAQCDANSYLAYIRDHHIFVSPKLTEADLVGSGMHGCELLRAGMTPEQISQGLALSDIRGLVDAAQRELCPDTLH